MKSDKDHSNSNRVRRVDVDTGVITTVVGNGSGIFEDGVLALKTGLWGLWSVVLDRFDNIYIPESTNRVRCIDSSTGIIKTVVGSTSNKLGDGGLAIMAAIDRPHGVAVDRYGNIFVADTSNNRIRKVDVSNGIITTIAGTGESGFNSDGILATDARLSSPHDVVVDDQSNIYIPETGTHRVRRVDGKTGIVSTVAGTGESGFSGDGDLAVEAYLNAPHSVHLDKIGNIFVIDTLNYRVRKIDVKSGVINTVAGGGTAGLGDGGLAVEAQVAPHGAAVDSGGNIFIADRDNYRVRRVDAETGLISTFAGNGEKGYSGDGDLATNASLETPQGVAFDTSGNLLIADVGGDPSRRI